MEIVRRNTFRWVLVWATINIMSASPTEKWELKVLKWLFGP